MFKTMSAALFAVSMLAAPALAAGPSHVVTAPGHVTAAGPHAGSKARMHKHHAVRHHHVQPRTHRAQKHHAHKHVAARTAPRR